MKLPTVTADSGYLIGLERRKPRARLLLASARQKSIRIVAPVAAIAEWWRGGRRQEEVLRLVSVEAMDEKLARRAGEAIAGVPGATVVDAIVMASAAVRGDVVYTSDFDDLTRLRAYFPGVRVLGV